MVRCRLSKTAGVFGHPYRLQICALTETVPVAGNLHFSNLVPFGQIKLQKEDTLFVSGIDTAVITSDFLRDHQPVCAVDTEGVAGRNDDLLSLHGIPIAG